MKKVISITFLAALLFAGNNTAQAQSDISEYSKYDFVPGEVVIMDDNLVNDKVGAAPLLWNVEGGKATVAEEKNEKCISINEYYTRLSPAIKTLYQIRSPLSMTPGWMPGMMVTQEWKYFCRMQNNRW
jgi:hypothetical protein